MSLVAGFSFLVSPASKSPVLVLSSLLMFSSYIVQMSDYFLTIFLCQLCLIPHLWGEDVTASFFPSFPFSLHFCFQLCSLCPFCIPVRILNSWVPVSGTIPQHGFCHTSSSTLWWRVYFHRKHTRHVTQDVTRQFNKLGGGHRYWTAWEVSSFYSKYL